ncbi:hypothetical protein CsSME_00035691 [Camellia sinensis var. sinensis]
MPSLYEAFTIIDSDECRRRLVQPVSSPVPEPPASFDQMAFVANSRSRPFARKVIYHYCRESGHVKAHCFKLNPKLKHRFSHANLSSSSRTAIVVEIVPSCSTPNLHLFQTDWFSFRHSLVL